MAAPFNMAGLGELLAGMDVLLRDEEAYTEQRERLRDAILEDRPEEFTALLDGNPALANETNDYTGQPVLNFAALCGRTTMVQQLLDRGAKLHARDHCHYGQGQTALLAAAADGEVDVVKLLLSRGARINDTAGAEMIHPQILGYGISEEQVKTTQHGGRNGQWNDHGWTALMHGAYKNYATMCAALVMRGADPSPRSRWGKTAKDLATEAVVKAILSFAEGSELAPPPDVAAVLLAHAPEEFRKRITTLFCCFQRLETPEATLDKTAKQRIVDFCLGVWMREAAEQAECRGS